MGDKGRGYENMTDEQVAKDMEKRFGTVREAVVKDAPKGGDKK